LAIYRLSVQTIQRNAGRSAVAAAAYRAGVALADERLGMTFDFRRKDGVEHREVMAPAGTPEHLLDREALWNAAERADRRKDSVPAREILIALPHELNAEQRRDLVRDFVQETLVKRGMIADVAIHTPGKEGDQRNYHAHILVTTREVGPEGFAKKNPDWHSPELVVVARHEWARVQNRHLEIHLGPDAPQVSARSLAERGIQREPEPKMGPEATALQRRDEFTFRGAQRQQVDLHNAETARRNRELAQQMRPENTPRIDRQTVELAREMTELRDVMIVERDRFKAQREAIERPRVPSVKQLENQLTAAPAAARRRVRQALERAEAEARAQGMTARQIAAWTVNPAAALMSAAKRDAAKLGHVLTAREGLQQAERALASRRAWVGSDKGQAFIANVREPALAAASAAATERRTLERKFKRIDVRIGRASEVVRDLWVARELEVKTIAVPGTVPMDRRREAGQDRRIAAIGRPAMRSLEPFPPLTIQAALQRLAAPTIELGAPTFTRTRGRDIAPDFDIDF
jgi:hypothetical protein